MGDWLVGAWVRDTGCTGRPRALWHGSCVRYLVRFGILRGCDGADTTSSYFTERERFVIDLQN